ncbi:hypothetical protein Vretifemale_15838, partial [Volvox reticuliferus]
LCNHCLRRHTGAAARRLDLHYAIEIHGGYLHVAARLGRRVTWAPSKHLYDSPAAVRRELSAVAKELQLPPGRAPVGADSATVAAMTTPPLLLPRLSQLRTAGRHDLIYALSIRHAGRQQELAELAGLQLARDGRGRNRNALSLEAVVEAIQAGVRGFVG